MISLLNIIINNNIFMNNKECLIKEYLVQLILVSTINHHQFTEGKKNTKLNTIKI